MTRERLDFRDRIHHLARGMRGRFERIDNPEVRKARQLARRTARGSLDVVYLAESTAMWTSPQDADRRPLHQMIRDDLGELATHAICGAGYNPGLFAGYINQVRAGARPPVVVLPLAPRMSSVPWANHPIHGHREAAAFLSRLASDVSPSRIRLGISRPTRQDWDRFHRLPHPTWAGDWVVGDYVSRLRGRRERDEEWVRLIYAYHHGGAVPESSLRAITSLGARLRALRVPLVAYQTPLPVERGVELHGDRFRVLAQSNFASMEQALVEGYGPTDILQTGLILPTSSFIDPDDATEHINIEGRLVLADAICRAVRERAYGPSKARASAELDAHGYR